MKTKVFNFEEIQIGTKVLLDGKMKGEIVCMDPVTAVLNNDYGKFAMCFDEGGYGLFWNVDGSRMLDDQTPRLELIVVPKLASDLSGVQQGVPVYDLAFGWGAIHQVFNDRMSASFGNYTKSYGLTGCPIDKGFESPNQTLFLREIKFEIPAIE